MKKYTLSDTLKRQLSSILEEGLWYMFPIYLFGSLSAGIAPVLTTIFSKAITELITSSSSGKQITETVIILTACTAVSFAIGHMLQNVCEGLSMKLRSWEFIRCADLFHDVEFKNIEDPA